MSGLGTLQHPAHAALHTSDSLCVVPCSALPMFCYMRLVFDISPTGYFKSKFIIEGMNIQEYLPESFWLQALLEIIVIMWTWWHVNREVRMRGSKKPSHEEEKWHASV